MQRMQKSSMIHTELGTAFSKALFGIGGILELYFFPSLRTCDKWGSALHWQRDGANKQSPPILIPTMTGMLIANFHTPCDHGIPSTCERACGVQDSADLPFLSCENTAHCRFLGVQNVPIQSNHIGKHSMESALI